MRITSICFFEKLVDLTMIWNCLINEKYDEHLFLIFLVFKDFMEFLRK